jgi:FdhD protein
MTPPGDNQADPRDPILDAQASVVVERVRGDRVHTDHDQVVVEEPLEIQVQGASVAVTMRTPGHDAELACGFLLTENVVSRREDVATLVHANEHTDPRSEDNVLRVTLHEEVTLDLNRLRRNVFASSSCGVCGKATLEAALATHAPLEDGPTFPRALFGTLPEKMRAQQAVFSQTGGLHAAALFSKDGELLVLREDVGRHNAVDKVVGHGFLNQHFPLSGHVLMVSGRISFEVVQKALAARIPVVAAISAPTSLAVELANQSGMALVGFLRPGQMTVYGKRERIR